MTSHDPSTCLCCGWAAEWLKATKLWDGEITRWIRKGQIIRSFCASLDAVAGLIRELGEKGLGCLGYYNGSWCWFWPEEWPGPAPEPEWWWQGMHGPEPIESDDYSCVIEAAMAVLGGKESDGSS